MAVSSTVLHEVEVRPCWRVEKGLDARGIACEVVKGPVRPGKRVDLQRLSGQKFRVTCAAVRTPAASSSTAGLPSENRVSRNSGCHDEL